MSAAVNVAQLKGPDGVGVRARLASLKQAIARRGGEILHVAWDKDPTAAGMAGATVLYVVNVAAPAEPVA